MSATPIAEELPRRNRTRLANGTTLFGPGANGRSWWARHFGCRYRVRKAQIGDRWNEALDSDLRSLAVIDVELQTRIDRRTCGVAFDAGEYTSLLNCQRRIEAKLGIDTSPRPDDDALGGEIEKLLATLGGGR